MLALVNELTGAALDVLVMVDELTGFHKSGPMPSMRPLYSVGIGAKPARQDGQRGRRNGGGSPWVPLPAGTTEAHVNGMILVGEVEGEATPSRPNPA